MGCGWKGKQNQSGSSLQVLPGSVASVPSTLEAMILLQVAAEGAKGEVDWVRDKKGTRAQLPVHCLSYMRDARNVASAEARRGGN